VRVSRVSDRSRAPKVPVRSVTHSRRVGGGHRGGPGRSRLPR
jgi:hypothetical protein